jgi:hypothetical protein
MSVDAPLDGTTPGHSNDQTPQQVPGGKVSANPNEEGEQIRRESDLRVTTTQNYSVNPQCKIEDDAVHARQPEQPHRRIKELEDELDKFRRVCLFMTSNALLSLVLHSGRRSKALRYWLSRRSSRR